MNAMAMFWMFCVTGLVAAISLFGGCMVLFGLVLFPLTTLGLEKVYEIGE